MSGSFRVVPGHVASTVIVHVPHSSRLIPPDVRAGIMLDDLALERELDALTDAFTDVIAEEAADKSLIQPWLFINNLSRLVVDPERFPDDREELNAVGMGAVYEKTSDGFALRPPGGAESSDLIERYFTPYAKAMTDLVDARLAAMGHVTIIDLHSYPLKPNPYELHADGPRPEICIGSDPFHTPDALVVAARESLGPVAPTGDVDTDSPFAGCYVPLKHYERERRVRAVMIELRRDVFTDSPQALDQRRADLLAGGLATFIDEVEQRFGCLKIHPYLPDLENAFGVENVSALMERLKTLTGNASEASIFIEMGDPYYLTPSADPRYPDTHPVLLPASQFDLIDQLDHVEKNRTWRP